MTDNEYYDFIVENLAAQEFKQSMDPKNERCVYRGNDGRKCAIGHCIPDEKYFQEMDNGWFYASLRDAGLLEGMSLNFFDRIQDAHDCCNADPKRMKAALRDVGEDFGFEIPEVLL